MSDLSHPINGAGLGLRRSFAKALLDSPSAAVDFLEVAPENWMGIGGRLGKLFRSYTERYSFVAHGLSLSIGSPSRLDLDFLHQLKLFLRQHNFKLYTEHLSYCSVGGHMYDLMPIPFTEEAVHYVAQRIRQVQEILEMRIAMENVSYYAAPGQEMSELQFINAVIKEADCDLLLDVNNIYVNSINHDYDAYEFLNGLPGSRAVYVHVAGHYEEAEDLRVDTHGADVIDPVWALLEAAYDKFGKMPTLLERDFNIPSLEQLMQEVQQIKKIQAKFVDPVNNPVMAKVG